MGGYGSGPGGDKTVVEDCHTLSIYFLRRNLYPSGNDTLSWLSGSGKIIASIGVMAQFLDRNVQVYYTITAGGQKQDIKEKIGLTRTCLFNGGMRYWFVCPSCHNRAGKLYMPPGGIYFRCRKCYNLTYQSCKDSRKYDKLLALMGSPLGLTAKQVRGVLKKGSRLARRRVNSDH